MAESVLGVVLAGGRGRRLGGVDKGLQTWRGRPLIDHIVTRLRPQVDRLWIVANRNQKTYAHWAERVLSDEVGGFCGPLEGLATALAACRDDWLLAVPVDLPLLPLDLQHRLRTQTLLHAAPLAVATDGRRRQVLCLLARPALAASARACLQRGDAAVHSWQDACGVLEVDFSDCADAFMNLNRLPLP